MAHEFETGLFVGQPAWHGLGVVLRDPPSIEDAIVAAELDWTVKLEKLAIADGRQVRHQATVRESDNSILGVVGPGFVPLQNKDAFAWFQPLIEDGSVKLEAAGSLREGRRVWVLARCGDPADIVKGDEIRQFILLAHGHDGSLAIRVGFTSVRVVCANTLRASIEGDETASLIKIPHRESAVESLRKVRGVMDVARREFAATAEQMRELARHGCDEVTLRRYVREVFAPGKGDDLKAASRIVGKVVPLFETGRGAELPGVRGTLWGAFNAVTEFVTHERGKTADARVDAAWFGDGAKASRRALEVGLEFARAA